MRKFWPNSNYQFLSINQDRQLIITDDFLRSYLRRPELALIPESCAQEQKIHQLLTDNPRARIDPAEIKKMEEERNRRLEDHNKMLMAQSRIFSNQGQQPQQPQIDELRKHYEKQIGEKVYLINELLKKIKELNAELSQYKVSIPLTSSNTWKGMNTHCIRLKNLKANTKYYIFLNKQKVIATPAYYGSTANSITDLEFGYNEVKAKQCALMLVDEILKAIPDASDDNSPYNSELLWWKEVRHEIENLKN